MRSRRFSLEIIENFARRPRRIGEDGRSNGNVGFGRYIAVALIVDAVLDIPANFSLSALAGKFLLERLGFPNGSLRRFGSDFRFFRFAIFLSTLENAHSITGLVIKSVRRSRSKFRDFKKS